MQDYPDFGVSIGSFLEGSWADLDMIAAGFLRADLSMVLDTSLRIPPSHPCEGLFRVPWSLFAGLNEEQARRPSFSSQYLSTRARGPAYTLPTTRSAPWTRVKERLFACNT
jgi:hypothetical protein